jgi:hypothetical protein
MLKNSSAIKSVKRKRILLLFTLLFISCFLFSCTQNNKDIINEESNENISTNVEATPNISKEQLNEFSDFFMSSNGQSFLATTWAFIKAYFGSDSVAMEEYLVDGVKAEPYKTDVFNDLVYINLQWSFSKIVSENEVKVSYIFEVENDSLTYLDIVAKKIDNEWKIASYTLEK